MRQVAQSAADLTRAVQFDRGILGEEDQMLAFRILLMCVLAFAAATPVIGADGLFARGRVVDQEGEQVAGIRVYALMQYYKGGEMLGSLKAGTMTTGALATSARHRARGQSSRPRQASCSRASTVNGGSGRTRATGRQSLSRWP